MLYLFVANLDGTKQEALTKQEAAYGHGALGTHFFWDLNSQNILYFDQKGGPGSSGYDIYSINIKTKKKVKIISEEANWDPNNPSQFQKVEVIPAGYFQSK